MLTSLRRRSQPQFCSAGYVAIVLASLALFAVGAVIGVRNGRGGLRSAMRQLLIGDGAALLMYVIGRGVGALPASSSAVGNTARPPSILLQQNASGCGRGRGVAPRRLRPRVADAVDLHRGRDARDDDDNRDGNRGDGIHRI